MKRKIVAQGNQSLTLTLPIKWIREQKLKAGDEIDVDERGGELVLGRLNPKPGGLCKINLTSELNNSKLVRYLIFGAYRSGASEIEISFEPLKLYDRDLGYVKTIKWIQDTVNLLIGVSIVAQTKNACTIKDITGASEEEFDNIFRRTFLLILSLGEQSYKASEEKDKEAADDVSLIFDSIRKFTEYLMRLLSKYEHKQRQNTAHFYSIVTCFDDLNESYRHLTKHFTCSPLSKAVLKAYQDLNNYVRETYKWFYNSTDPKIIQELFRLREISYKSIYSADSPKSKRADEGGLLEAIMAIWITTTQIIKERMAMTVQAE
jgi:phosphate uptake regulator